jgi:hypothetical protein
MTKEVIPEINPIHKKLESENKDVLALINKLVLNKEYKGDINNKKEIFNSIQDEWYDWAIKNNIVNSKDKTQDTLEYITTICTKLSESKSGFASSPKLYEILPEDSNGLDCLSAAMVLASILDKKGIDYSFISPVGHVSLMVKIDNKDYYFDPRNNQIVCLDGLIKDITKESENFDIINFDERVSKEHYSFAFKYNNKEDIVASIIMNILVLNNLNNGINYGASKSLEKQIIVAKILSDKLRNFDISKIGDYQESNFHLYFDRNIEMIEKEEKRLTDIGFYGDNR